MPDKLCNILIKSNGIAVLAIPGNISASAKDILEALRHQTTVAAAKEAVKGMMLTGSKSGFCFCKTGKNITVHEAASLSAFGQQVMFALEKTGKPCIAAIESECSGLGLEIALSCDFIVASAAASFGFPDIANGLLPFCGGSQRLSRLVGKSKTKELIYSGEMTDATEAHRIGLVNRLYPDDVQTQAEKLLEHICTRSPRAIRIGGEVVNAGYDIDLQTACLLERNAFALCFASFDQREGMQAFLDKRHPQFRGE